MPNPTLIPESNTAGNYKTSIRLAIFGLSLLFIAGCLAIYFFIRYEKNRDLIVWQDKLSYLSQLEKKAIDQKLDQISMGLQNIVENTTVKLYVTEELSQATKNGQSTLKRNYQRYLKELLIIQGAKLGFSGKSRHTLNLNQKTQQTNANGLMIIAPSGHVLASGESGVISIPEPMLQDIKSGHFIQRMHIQELISPDNPQLHLSFIAPIFPPQVSVKDRNAKAIAYLVAIKNMRPELNTLLAPALATRQHETITLLRKYKNQVLYLLSLGEQKSPLGIKRQLSVTTPNLDSANALQTPKHFLQEVNHLGQNVLLYSHKINRLPWVIMHSVNQDYALSESNTHAQFLYVGFTLLFITLVCLLILTWRHGTNLRYQNELVKLQSNNQELKEHNHLLQMITDNLSGYVMVLDNNHQLTYGNKALASLSGQNNANLAGQNIKSLLGNNTAKCLQNSLHSKYREEQIISIDNEQGSIMQTSYIPLIEDGEELSLIIGTDISACLEEGKQKERVMEQAVLMLTKILEQHDPYSSEHSLRVKTVALLLGKDLGLNETDLFNLAISANLINIGKFYVPSEILLKQDKLSSEEQNLIQEHIVHTIKMLKEINMPEQIIQSVSQSYERIDGSGYPLQLQGENINLFARILAASNTFVAMIYPRPWRQAKAQIESLDLLMKDPGYDKKVVVALYNIVENKGTINL